MYHDSESRQWLHESSLSPLAKYVANSRIKDKTLTIISVNFSARPWNYHVICKSLFAKQESEDNFCKN